MLLLLLLLLLELALVLVLELVNRTKTAKEQISPWGGRQISP